MITTINNYFQIDILEDTQKGEYVRGRNFYCLFQKMFNPKKSLARIGADIGKDHATVIHAIRTINNDMETMPEVRQMYEELLPLIKQSLPMKRIYLSGKITGLDPTIVLMKFHKAKIRLEHEHWQVVTPTILMATPDQSWNWYMVRALALQNTCNATYFLKDWDEESEGACMEMENAKYLNHKIIFE